MERQVRTNQPLINDCRNNDYVARMWQLTHRFNKLVILSNFEFYLHMLGTNVTVKRVGDSEFKQALGASYIFDGTETADVKVETFTKRIIINRSLMLRNYRSAIDDIDAYVDEDFYMIGDQIEFNYFDINFRYKVNDIEQFEPYGRMLYKLTLSGFEEYRKT